MEHPKVTRDEAERLVRQQDGVYVILRLLEDGRIDLPVAIDVVAGWQEHTCQRAKRFLLAVGDAIFSS